MTTQNIGHVKVSGNASKFLDIFSRRPQARLKYRQAPLSVVVRPQFQMTSPLKPLG